jgi:toxin FitB
MAMVVLDTDAASLLHKDRIAPDVEGLLLGNVVCVPFVTEAELFKWGDIHDWGASAARTGCMVVRPRRDASFGSSDGQDVGSARGSCAEARASSACNDTWVAACCIARDLPLITFNRRDFLDFQEHDGLVLLTE